MPYIARILGVELVGISSYTLSVVMFFGTFALFGINMYGSRTIAAHREDRELSSKNFWAIFLMKIFSVSATTIGFVIYLANTNYSNKYFLFLQVFNLLAIALDVSWFYVGNEDFKNITLRNLFVRVISLLAIFGLVKNQHHLARYILILPASTIAGHLLLYPGVIRTVGKPIFSYSIMRSHLPSMLSVFITQIAIQFYATFDKVIIGYFVGDQKVGVYDYAQKIVRISMVIVGSLSTVMLPRISHLWKKQQIDELKHYFEHSVLMSAFVVLPIFFGLIATSKPLVSVLFPPDFSDMSLFLLLFSPCIIFWSINNITGLQILMPMGHEKYLTIAVIAGAIVNLSLNTVFLKYFGISAAVIIYSFTELVVTITQVYFVLKIFTFRFPTIEIIKTLIASVIMFAILNFLIIKIKNDIVLLISELMIGTVTYLFFCYLLRSKAMVFAIKTIFRRGF